MKQTALALALVLVWRVLLTPANLCAAPVLERAEPILERAAPALERAAPDLARAEPALARATLEDLVWRLAKIKLGVEDRGGWLIYSLVIGEVARVIAIPKKPSGCCADLARDAAEWSALFDLRADEAPGPRHLRVVAGPVAGADPSALLGALGLLVWRRCRSRRRGAGAACGSTARTRRKRPGEDGDQRQIGQKH